jgi:phosphatidylcholine synthase
VRGSAVKARLLSRGGADRINKQGRLAGRREGEAMRFGNRRMRKRLRPSAGLLRQALAWAVHFYTALGLLAAAGIAVCIIQGTPVAFHRAFVLMVVATWIDATDGTLARLVRVKEVLPGFDGRRLDDLIDFLTYVSLPLLLLWRADILPGDQGWWLLFPLFASAYGFSQVSAKTEDGFFLGFPSCWNLVAFYLYVLHPPEWVSIGLLLLFSVLTFVPTRYLYPSQRGRLNAWTNLFGVAWTILLLVILFFPGGEEFGGRQTRVLTLISLVFPVYYLVMSWVISLRLWRKRRRRQEQEFRQVLT